MFTKIKFIIVSLAIILFGCNQSNPTQNEEPSAASHQKFTVDTFSTFPPEIDGCACYFANNAEEYAKSHYIYVNDFAQISFLKINGELVKFTQTAHKKIDDKNTTAVYKSELYEMTIDVKDGQQSGDETTLKTGTIKITDKNRTTLIKTFYGECGC